MSEISIGVLLNLWSGFEGCHESNPGAGFLLCDSVPTCDPSVLLEEQSNSQRHDYWDGMHQKVGIENGFGSSSYGFLNELSYHFVNVWSEKKEPNKILSMRDRVTIDTYKPRQVHFDVTTNVRRLRSLRTSTNWKRNLWSMLRLGVYSGGRLLFQVQNTRKLFQVCLCDHLKQLIY